MTTFNDYMKENAEQLDMFTLAITRAHGKNHLEAFEVHDLYNTMSDKTKEAGEVKPNLDTEFNELRDVTNNYAIPNDVCETYVAVYDMLSEADQAYQT